MSWHIKIPGNDTEEIANALAALARAKGTTIGKLTRDLIINHLTENKEAVLTPPSFFATIVPSSEQTGK